MAFVVLVVLTLSMLLAHILLRNCHQLFYHLPRSNSCIKGSWQGWSEEGDSKFLKCLTTSIANHSSCIHPLARYNEAFYTSTCVNILMMAPFSIYDACPGKSRQWWWVQRGCRPSVPEAWICAQSALEHDSMQAIGPGAHSEAGQMSTSVLLTWPHWPSPSVTWAMTAIDHRDYWREHLLQ